MPPVAAVRINVRTPSACKDANGKRHGFEVVTFVVMKAALKRSRRAHCSRRRRRDCRDVRRR